MPPQAQTAPHGQTHAPLQGAPPGQSESLQHWPGGGFISQLPPTHTIGAPGFCGQAASVVQQLATPLHWPMTSSLSQKAPQGHTEAPRQLDPGPPQS